MPSYDRPPLDSHLKSLLVGATITSVEITKDGVVIETDASRVVFAVDNKGDLVATSTDKK